MAGTQRTLRQDCEVLLRQIDGRLATLRSALPGRTGTGRTAGTTAGRKTAGTTAGGKTAGTTAERKTAGTTAEQTELAEAERTADALRRLVADTARASAADRARVRAAVHYFVSGGKTRTPSWRYGALTPGLAGRRNDRRVGRSLGDDVRVVNEILRDLGGGSA